MSSNAPIPFPQMHYFRCVDASNKPAAYVGEWPVAGMVYAGHVKTCFRTGQPHFYIDGFWAESPYGAFVTDRFEHVFTIYLN